MASFSSGVPPTGVYRVNPSLMARMAASRMFAGVSKSGSPTPKWTMSTPWAFSWLALAFRARVAEGGIWRIRRASCNVLVLLNRDFCLRERYKELTTKAQRHQDTPREHFVILCAFVSWWGIFSSLAL